MRFQITLEDGSQLVGNVSVPGIDIGRGPRPDAEVTGRAVADALVPGIAAKIAPLLPPAAPARRTIERDQSGKITGATVHPAISPPAIRAGKIARQLASTLAPEYASAIAAKYAALDAAQARAQATAKAQAPADDLARRIQMAARRLAKSGAMTPTKGQTR